MRPKKGGTICMFLRQTRWRVKWLEDGKNLVGTLGVDIDEI